MTLEELEQALSNCVRCGRCLAGCPLYDVIRKEGASARGKLALLHSELKGQADLAGRMKDLLSYCLSCGACQERCVNQVKADELIEAGRALVVENRGLDGVKRMLVRDVLSRGPLSRSALKSRPLWEKKVSPESGLHFRFPLPGLDRSRWLPPLAEKPFLNGSSNREIPEGDGPVVALFVGCVANYIHPATARAAVEVLEAAGARVVIPPEQVCCGKPASGSGDQETALFLARKNRAAFSRFQYDYLAAFCSTCSGRLKQYGEMEGLEGVNWSGRVRDLSELLIQDLNWRPGGGRTADSSKPLKVFYHDPCHLRRKQGIHREPRELIECLPDVSLVGAEQPPRCCGYGGLFNLWHYDLSQEIFQRRFDSLVSFEPEVIVTPCSGCLLQFEDGLRRMNSGMRVSSLVELIAEYGL